MHFTCADVMWTPVGRIDTEVCRAALIMGLPVLCDPLLNSERAGLRTGWSDGSAGTGACHQPWPALHPWIHLAEDNHICAVALGCAHMNTWWIYTYINTKKIERTYQAHRGSANSWRVWLLALCTKTAFLGCMFLKEFLDHLVNLVLKHGSKTEALWGYGNIQALKLDTLVTPTGILGSGEDLRQTPFIKVSWSLRGHHQLYLECVHSNI